MASRKKSLITKGQLDKHGKPNDQTPADFLQSYQDYSQSHPPKLTGQKNTDVVKSDQEGPDHAASDAVAMEVEEDTTNTTAAASKNGSEKEVKEEAEDNDDDDDKKRPASDGSVEGAPDKKKEKKDKKKKKKDKKKKG
jgi:H/ACA ribonucleoprotein complex subunit 4